MGNEYKGIAINKEDYFDIADAKKHIDQAKKNLSMSKSYYYSPVINAVLIQSESFFILQGSKPGVLFTTEEFEDFKNSFDQFSKSLNSLGEKILKATGYDKRPAEIKGLINNCIASYEKSNNLRLKEDEKVVCNDNDRDLGM